MCYAAVSVCVCCLAAKHPWLGSYLHHQASTCTTGLYLVPGCQHGSVLVASRRTLCNRESPGLSETQRLEGRYAGKATNHLVVAPKYNGSCQLSILVTSQAAGLRGCCFKCKTPLAPPCSVRTNLFHFG